MIAPDDIFLDQKTGSFYKDATNKIATDLIKELGGEITILNS